MPVKPQSLENHVHWVPLYHFVLSLLLLVNLFFWVRVTLLAVTGSRLAGLCVAVALILLYFYARLFALTVQDRVIRLEMRLRMERLLPPDLMSRFADLEPKQLVALRFAGDGELAELTRRVLAGELRTNSQIKKQVKDWQADWLRA